MSEQLQSVLLDRPREVDVDSIERELTDLWRQSADDDGQPSPIVRACALNLIVLTERETELDELANSVGDLTVEHPSRSFIVCADRSQNVPSLDVLISVRCSLPGPGGRSHTDQDKQVCCEQITLKARGGDTAKIPSVITSLLVPDVPTAIVWKGVVNDRDGVLLSLIKLCDRALIDSSEDSNPEQRLVAWGDLFDTSPGHAAFGDLSWRHTSTWRRVIADAFQPADLRGHLLSLDSLTIRYSTRLDPPHSGLSQSLLLIGWLAHALQWRMDRPLQKSAGNGYSGTMKLEEQLVQIHSTPVNDGRERLGEVESVALHSSKGLNIVFEMAGSRDCIRVVHNAGVGTGTETKVPARIRTETELLSEELEELHSEVSYEKSMKILVALLRNRR